MFHNILLHSSIKAVPEHDNWLVRARAETEPYPANIYSYHNLGDHESVIKNWQAANRLINDETPVKLLIDSATVLNDFDTIQRLLPQSSDFKQVTDLLNLCGSEQFPLLVKGLPVAIAHAIESQGEWKQFAGFVEKQSTSNGQLNSALKKAKIGWPKEVLIASVVRAMARSERLALAQSKAQRDASNFLRRNLVIERDANTDKQRAVQSVFELIDIEEATRK